MTRPYFVPKRPQICKRTIKFLAVNPDPTLARRIVQKAPVSVVKSICNAAVNAQRGDVYLSRNQKRKFRRLRQHFKQLADPSIPLSVKRKIQTGGAFPAIIAPLLLSVLGSLGSSFISGLLSNNRKAAE